MYRISICAKLESVSWGVAPPKGPTPVQLTVLQDTSWGHIEKDETRLYDHGETLSPHLLGAIALGRIRQGGRSNLCRGIARDVVCPPPSVHICISLS